MIPVGIEQKIWRIQDPDSVPIKLERCRQAQSADKGRVLVVTTITVGILMYGDLICTRKMVGWWQWHLVVNASQEFVATDHRQACRQWILQILHNPHAATLIEFDG